MVVDFGSCLLGKHSHDSLLKLQDYEIKLLDVIKKTVAARIKLDRDYGNSLLQLASQTTKLFDKPIHNSLLYNAWNEVVNELSDVGRTVKSGADTLHESTYEKITMLAKDKIAIKKYYAENRERVDNDLFRTIHNELEQKHGLYQRLDSEVLQAKRNYESAVEKGKMNPIEKMQDKYRKSTMKLHLSHNAYVLQLLEARLHQDHYRETILPEVLNGLQDMEVEFVKTAKGILSEYLRHTSPCRHELMTSHQQAEDRLNDVDPQAEYRPFVDTNRTPLETSATISFEPVPGEGSMLPYGEVVLDSLTVQGIEHLTNDFHDDLAQIQEQISENQHRLVDLDEEIQQLESNISNLSLMSKQLTYTQTKLSASELLYQKTKYASLHKYLVGFLDDLGDKEPKPGLRLPDLDCHSAASIQSDHSAPRLSSPNSHGGSVFKKFNRMVPLLRRQESNKQQQLQHQPQEAGEVQIFDHSRVVREQGWFHGTIPRKEVENLVKDEGDFLLRESNNHPGELVLSAQAENVTRHFKIQKNEQGWYRFEGEAFKSVTDLVQHHYVTQAPLTHRTQCIILKPVFKDKWQLTHDELDIEEKLGQGNFGDVFRAYLRSRDIWVAVKTCKSNVDSNTREKFLAEARILKGYDHPNVVKLIGVCTGRQPIYIVMELITGGDLAGYLKGKQYTLKPKQLVKLCKDACSGLAYLEVKKCIHRDVAARNCLVTDAGSVKITDFGMSREEEDGVYTVNGRMKSIPMKWTAPEAMNYGQFTSASDVWSFGILSWEVFNFGKQPYPRMTNQQAREKVDSGYRMPIPEGCPPRYYNEVMARCWQYQPEHRPTFAQLYSSIESIVKSL